MRPVDGDRPCKHREIDAQVEQWNEILDMFYRRVDRLVYL
jgi:hypothetical protein